MADCFHMNQPSNVNGSNIIRSILLVILSSTFAIIDGHLLSSLPATNVVQPNHSIRSPIIPHSDGSILNSTNQPFTEIRSHKPEKPPLTQSLNDLFSDLLSKPLGLSHLTNTSFLSLEHLITDKVKLPRPLNVLINTLANTESSNSRVEQNNLETNELTEPLHHHHHHHGLRGSAKLSGKNKSKYNNKKKSTPLSSLSGRCYEPYGCFRIAEPFRSIYRPISLVPEPPSAIKVAFYLRTRSNPTMAERLPYTESSKFLESQFFHPLQKLKIIVHGYLESSDEPWIKEMSGALLNRQELNVICVDWMLGAAPPYTQAVANTRLVGAMIAHLIRIIQDTYPDQYPANWIHIIGHSLGAHIAGYAGEQIGNLGQITGLDPAEPYFQYTVPAVRLDPSDANFVDVVHTDVASIISGGFGMNQTCGHVDFYPNGGINQPGCKEAPIKNVWDSISKERTVFDGIRRFIGCNHLRSFLLYIEAINSECPFMAFPCRNYDDFTSGQCTKQLIDQHYTSQCFGQHHLMMSDNVTACPIRLGLESSLDYRQHLKRLPQSSSPTSGSTQSASLTYFMQTADRVPFCHYHYQVTVFVRLINPVRMTHHFLGRQLTIDNLVTVLNGKLILNIVGTRNRALTEIAFKIPDSKENGDEIDSNQDIGQITKELYGLISTGDLGDILRIELEWRPLNSMARPLIPMQSRALRRWLSQLSSLESPIPNVLGDIQRAFNINGTQLPGIVPHSSHNWPSHNNMNDIVHTKASSSSLSSLMPTSSRSSTDHNPSMPIESNEQIETIPLLDAIVVTHLDIGKQRVFCVTENPLRMIFSAKPLSRIGTLIVSTLIDLKLDNSLQSTIGQLCNKENFPNFLQTL